jgi:hypothetical protein
MSKYREIFPNGITQEYWDKIKMQRIEIADFYIIKILSVTCFSK